jgi:hypothetical protein
MGQVQVLLGHARYAFTADVYATYKEVAAASADAAEQFIPLRIAAGLRRTWDSNHEQSHPS